MVLRLAARGADVDLYICTLLPVAGSRAIFVATLAPELGINSCLLPSVEFHHTHVLDIINKFHRLRQCQARSMD